MNPFSILGIVTIFAALVVRGVTQDVVAGFRHFMAHTAPEFAALKKWLLKYWHVWERFCGGCAISTLYYGIMLVSYLWHLDLLVSGDALICIIAAGGGVLWIKLHISYEPATLVPLATNATRWERFEHGAQRALEWARKTWTIKHRSPFTTSLKAVFAFGMTMLFVSATTATAGNHVLGFLALVYILFVMPGLAFLYAWPVLRGIKGGIRFSEVTTDSFFLVIQQFGGMFRSAKGVNYADEEQILPNFYAAVSAYISVFASPCVANMFLPGLTTIIVSHMVSLTITVGWLVLNGAGVKIRSRQVQSALLFAWLGLIAVSLMILHVSYPTWRVAVVGWVEEVWHNGIKLLSLWEAIIGFSISSGACVLVIWRWKPKSSKVQMKDGTREKGLPIARTFRGIIALACGAMAFLCGVSVALAGHYGDSVDTFGAFGVRLSVMHAPTATAEDNAVRLAWPKAGGAMGYLLEWRRPTEGTFHRVMGAKHLGNGVLEYLDTNVESGAEYYYRAVALYPNWESEPSPEVHVVTIAKAKARPYAAEPKPSAVPTPASDLPAPVAVAAKPKPVKAKAPCAGMSKMPGDLAFLVGRWAPEESE